MQSDLVHPQQNCLHGCTLTDISGILPDQRVQKFLISQLSALPRNSYTLYVAFHKIYLIVQLNHYLSAVKHPSLEKQEQPEEKSADIESKYAIKISRSFPLKHSVKVHLIDGGFQPKISDNRDLFNELMGKAYEHSIHLKDIMEQLVQLDQKLHKNNEQFLQLQKMGRFALGEKFYYQELSQLYSAVILFKDHNSRKRSTYIGLTETHVLCFQELETKQEHKRRYSGGDVRNTESTTNQRDAIEGDKLEETRNQLQLVTCAEMQCIDTILYRQNQKFIRILYKKYQSIKLYHEFEQIKRSYKFLHPEVFLRGVLKSITKFQHTQIQFVPFKSQTKKQKDSRPSVKQSMVSVREAERVNFCIDQAQKHELQLKKDRQGPDRKMHLQQIEKYYRKLIEYYSARTNPYYLIYVNKLNTLYARYFIKDKEGQKDSAQ